MRWGKLATENNQQFTGMKLTNTPATYTAFPVDADGYYFTKKEILWWKKMSYGQYHSHSVI
ncbi:hypothetical protein [Mucilaginibacter gracilis]